MESSDLTKRGTAKDFLDKKIGTLVVAMLYPSVLSYCYHKLDTEGAVKALRKLGENIMDDFLKIYKKKRSSFQDYLKDFFKIFYDSNVKITKVSDTLYHIIDDNCILCTDINVEGLPFHYCIPYAGSIKRMLVVLAREVEIPAYNYKVETIASKGLGAKQCIHSVELGEL